MAPKRKVRGSTKAVKSGKDSGPGKGDGEEVSPAEVPTQPVTGKRKTSASDETENRKRAKGDASTNRPQYCHWLMKSEPESRFENGIDVKARNFMRDMKEGQMAFFYHSNCKEPGVAGLMKIEKEAYVDHTQFDKKDVHYDASSKPDNPKWSMVDVQYQRMAKRFLTLAELKKYHLQHRTTGGPLKDMALFTRARLSVQPLTKEEFDFVLSLEDKDPL
ncbi:thymocyte nuclear protein 1 isoform X2 [Lampris incognitus]|uniref:thymocyte nuclear protein 1 isoform X2 n=1 Tax=Lampris incognitus TaxID=2546036 RepID=UPI0024B505FD|nr:thymocyte nuclear protein 1 isoform X2 [Lampris incognitus]